MTDIDNITKEKVQWRLDTTDWLAVLNNIMNLKSYYVGGGLMVDLEEGIFGFHLNGTLVEFTTGLSRPLSPEEHRETMAIYRTHKGETQYYQENLSLCPMEA